METYLEYIQTNINKDLDEYKQLLERGPIGIIEIYLKKKFRDGLSFGFGYNGVGSTFSREFDKACTQVTINKSLVISTLIKIKEDLIKSHVSMDEYRDTMNCEIEKILGIIETCNITESDSTIEPSNEVDSNIDNSNKLEVSIENLQSDLWNTLEKVKLKLDASIGDEWNKFSIGIYNTKIKCRTAESPDINLAPDIPFVEQYIISQYPGKNDINIGAYVGKATNGIYYYVPLGTQFINNIIKSSYSNVSMCNSYCRSFSKLENLQRSLVCELQMYLQYTNRIRPS